MFSFFLSNMWAASEALPPTSRGVFSWEGIVVSSCRPKIPKLDLFKSGCVQQLYDGAGASDGLSSDGEETARSVDNLEHYGTEMPVELTPDVALNRLIKIHS